MQTRQLRHAAVGGALLVLLALLVAALQGGPPRRANALGPNGPGAAGPDAAGPDAEGGPALERGGAAERRTDAVTGAAESDAAPLAPEMDTEPAAPARLLARLEAGDGLPVPRASLTLHGQGVALAFLETEPGLYVAEATAGFVGDVRVAELPTGFLPPRRQRSRYGAEQLELQPGDNKITLQVVRAARVHGRVFGADGSDLRGAHVRFDEARPGDPDGYLGSLYASAYESGWYELTLDPGRWIALAAPGWSPSEPPPPALYVHPAPPDLTGCVAVPSVFELGPGETRRVDVGWSAGTATLTLDVVDERGAAFADAAVMVCFASLDGLERSAEAGRGDEQGLGLGLPVFGGRTDAEGRLRVAGLAAARYAFVVEPEGYAAFAAPGTARVGHPPMTQYVEVSAEGARVRSIVPRAHPIEVEGRIAAPAAAPAADLAEKPKLQAVLGPRPWRSADRARAIPVAPDGTFRFWVDRCEGRLDIVVTTPETTDAVPLSWDPEGEYPAPLPVSIALRPQGGQTPR